jgi:YHS domain-containing protein
MLQKLLSAIAVFSVLSSAAVMAQKGTAKVTVPFFGNKSCPVTGKPAKETLAVKHNGERIFVCCKKCVVKVKEKPAVYHAKAYPSTKVVDIKNEKCPIMGGSTKGKKSSTVFQGRRVHYCCPMCDKKFRQEPSKHLAKLTQSGLKEVGNKMCPVTPKEKALPDSFLIYKGKIVNLCCAGCIDDFKKSPEKYLKIAMDGKGNSGKHDHSGH